MNVLLVLLAVLATVFSIALGSYLVLFKWHITGGPARVGATVVTSIGLFLFLGVLGVMVIWPPIWPY